MRERERRRTTVCLNTLLATLDSSQQYCSENRERGESVFKFLFMLYIIAFSKIKIKSSI